MHIIPSALSALVLSLASLVAAASPIVGSFGLSGNYAPLGGTSAGTATGIDFASPTGGITTCSGDYVSIFSTCAFSGGDAVTVLDIGVGVLPTSGGVALAIDDWISSGAFSFDLGAITNVTRSTSGLTSLTLEGTGLASSAGFEDTAGSFILTFNGKGAGQFTFSSSVETAAVPEPVSLALFGAGLAGLAVVRRRKR